MLYPTELRPRGTFIVAQSHSPPPAGRGSREHGRGAAVAGYFIVGMTNWALSRCVVGQREVTVFNRV